jgi:hypothetical protein
MISTSNWSGCSRRSLTFNVSSRFVIADLAPIAYLGLVEYIVETDFEADVETDVEADVQADVQAEPGTREAAVRLAAVRLAAVRLYDRLLPLLSCVHTWTPLDRAEDAALRKLTAASGGRVHICKVCTAYAFGETLPATGRGFAAPVE